MGMSHLLNRSERNFFNVDFIFGEIPEKLVPFDYDTFAAFPGEVVAVATNIHTGKAEYLPVPRDDRKFTTVVASCALPLLFQPVKVGHHYYVDGGVADSIPYKKAIEAGCDKNIVVLTQTRDYRKGTDRSTKLFSKMYCRYPKVAEAMLARADKYNACLDELKELEKEGKVFIIAPEGQSGIWTNSSGSTTRAIMRPDFCCRSSKNISKLNGHHFCSGDKEDGKKRKRKRNCI